MTWVVGTPTPFGDAACIADIRASWPDGRYLDCLQKVYPLAPKMAGAFAGSIEIGFAILTELTSFLRGYAGSDDTMIPEWVADALKPNASRWFKQFPAVTQEAGCSIMLLGVTPPKDRKAWPFAQAHVFVMRAPDFDPKRVAVGECGTIGSGRARDVCADTLRAYVSDKDAAYKLQVGTPQVGMAGLLALGMAITLRRQKPPLFDVGDRLVLGLVRLDRSDRYFSTIPVILQEPRGDGDVSQRQLPPLVTSWKDFQAECRHRGILSAAEGVG